jgi:hypothetical protein
MYDGKFYRGIRKGMLFPLLKNGSFSAKALYSNGVIGL